MALFRSKKVAESSARGGQMKKMWSLRKSFAKSFKKSKAGHKSEAHKTRKTQEEVRARSEGNPPAPVEAAAETASPRSPGTVAAVAAVPSPPPAAPASPVEEEAAPERTSPAAEEAATPEGEAADSAEDAVAEEEEKEEKEEEAPAPVAAEEAAEEAPAEEGPSPVPEAPAEEAPREAAAAPAETEFPAETPDADIADVVSEPSIEAVEQDDAVLLGFYQPVTPGEDDGADVGSPGRVLGDVAEGLKIMIDETLVRTLELLNCGDDGHVPAAPPVADTDADRDEDPARDASPEVTTVAEDLSQKLLSLNMGCAAMEVTAIPEEEREDPVGRIAAAAEVRQ